MIKINKTASLLSLLALSLFHSPAFALESGDAYYSVGIGIVNMSVDTDDATAGIVIAHFGKVIGQGLAIEGFLGKGIIDDEYNDSPGIDWTVGVNSVYGVRVKGFASLDSGSMFYGVIGYAETDIKAEQTWSAPYLPHTDDWSESDSDLIFGIGFDIAMGDSSGLVLEFTSLYGETIGNSDVDVLNLSASYRGTF